MSISSTGLSDHERRAGHSDVDVKLPEPLVVRPRIARRLLGDCSEESLWDMINSEELESYLDGRARYITMASIRKRIADKLAQAKDKIPTPRRGRPRKSEEADA